MRRSQGSPEVEGGPAPVGGKNLHQLARRVGVRPRGEGEEPHQPVHQAGVADRHAVLEAEAPHHHVVGGPGAEPAHGEQRGLHRFGRAGSQAVEIELAGDDPPGDADQVLRLASARTGPPPARRPPAWPPPRPGRRIEPAPRGNAGELHEPVAQGEGEGQLDLLADNHPRQAVERVGRLRDAPALPAGISGASLREAEILRSKAPDRDGARGGARAGRGPGSRRPPAGEPGLRGWRGRYPGRDRPAAERARRRSRGRWRSFRRRPARSGSWDPGRDSRAPAPPDRRGGAPIERRAPSSRRYSAGVVAVSRRKFTLKVDSPSYPTSNATSAIERSVVSSSRWRPPPGAARSRDVMGRKI